MDVALTTSDRGQRLGWIVLALAAVAAAGGFLWEGLYREPAYTGSQMRGQDLVTLIALPCTAAAQVLARKGSARGLLAWIGLLGYLFYTYTMAAFGFFFNELFLLYVALFALTGMTLIAVISGIDVEGLKRRFDSQAPVRAVAGYSAFIGTILLLMWVGQMMPFFLNGTLPDTIVRAETPTSPIYVLDLGLIFPMAMTTAVWLWRRKPWGYVLAGFMLFKAITMGSALLSMSLFYYLAGLGLETGLTVVWAVITLSGVGMSYWFLRHCR